MALPAYRASTYLVSAFPAHSTSFAPNIFNAQRWNVCWNSTSEFLLVVGIRFVSPWYDLSRLTGHKTSSIYLAMYPSSSSRSQCGLKSSKHNCFFHVSWTSKPFATKFDIVVHHHESKCCAVILVKVTESSNLLGIFVWTIFLNHLTFLNKTNWYVGASSWPGV